MRKLLAFLAIVLSAFASCSKGADSSEATPKELVYWSLWNKPEPQAQALIAIAESFEQEENGAKIKSIFNGRQSLVKLRSYLAADKQVDIFDGDGDGFMGLVTREDFVADLSDLVNGKDYSENMVFSDTILNGVLDTLRANEMQYGIPYILNIIAFFYSKQSFEAAGIAKPPATFDEFLDASRKLQEVGIDPIALEGNVGFYQLWYLTGIMQKVAGHNFLYDVIMDKTGASWDGAKVRQALEIEKQLIESGAIPPESSGYQFPAAQNNIAIGKTAMELVGSWLPTELSQAVDEDFQWGIFPFPDVAGGQNLNKIAIAPMAIGVYKKSENIETAKAFIRYLLSDSSQQKLVEIGNVGVSNKAIGWPNDLKDARDMLLNSDGAYFGDSGLSALLPDFMAKILVPTHSQFILGRISIDEFIQTMKDSTVQYWKQQ